MYFAYGRFLLTRPLPTSFPVVRHRLVWPVILSIGFGLYYGRNFSVLKISLKPLAPLSLILLLYVISEVAQWDMKRFLKRTLGASFLAVILFVLVKFGIIPLESGYTLYFSLMLFSVAASAYLAVFESWKVTSDVARQEDVISGRNSDEEIEEIGKASRYSIATAAALMLSVWLMPFFFVFSGYGTIFLVGFLLHASLAFSIWYLFGRGLRLRALPWGFLKITAGLLFLLILVLATQRTAQPNSHTIKWLVSAEGFSLLGVAAIYLVSKLIAHLRREYRKNVRGLFLRSLRKRVNFIRILGFLCWIACGVLLTLVQSYADNSPEYFKAELALDSYAGCIILCIIVDILDSFKGTSSMTMISGFLLGVVHLIRPITSCLIALTVFLPSVYKGTGVTESLLLAVPFFLSAAGGFALNDYFDANKDKINKPYRAIPSGRISAKCVLVISLVTLVFSFIIAASIARSRMELALYLLTLGAVSSYNLLVKHLSLSKTFVTSVVSSFPFLFVITSLNYPGIFFLLPVAATCFILGREWLMDIRDMKGDRREGIVTFPMIIGPGSVAKYSFMFQLIAVLLLLPITIVSKSVWSGVLLLLILFSTLILSRIWFINEGKYQRRAIQILWLPMLFGILLLIS
jgi:geranylgeranylglycerol-phosphate geranylgeranyltransferase